MKSDLIIAMHKNVDFGNRLKHHLPERYHVVEKRNARLVILESRIRQVSCVILHVEQDIPGRTVFQRFKKGFPNIPCVAVVVPQSMELARTCGTLGIESVLPIEEMERIGDEIDRVCSEKNNRVRLSEITIFNGVAEIKYSPMITEALSIMEQEYAKLLNTREISELMEISECTLSREFAKYGLPGPKQMLMHLKVHQAIKLMRNEGLNVREISSLSGFTDEKRMAECFKRMYGIPPGEYRIKNIRSQAYEECQKAQSAVIQQ